jgi:parallel beta-helix repeat protein
MRFKKSKLFIIPVCLILFVSFMLVSPVFAATTWHVDDSGGADFTTISAAVASSTAGDTIIVKDGTYNENVVVNKTLTVKSENGFATTFVQAASASADVFLVTAAGVTIDGFTVSGATSMGKAGVHIFGSSVGSCTIKNNLCTGNSYGIAIDPDHAGGNAVTNNICTANGRYGIELTNTVGNIVADNIVWNHTQSSGYGIYLADNADNNTVTDNTCYLNIYGLRVKAADLNTMIKNSVSNNSYGMEIATGSVGNVFYLNNFVNSTTANFNKGTGAVAGNFWNSQEQIEYWFDGASRTNYTGNYWGNYAGTDADGNGIGDTPYSTFSASEGDNYPLMAEYATYFQLPIPKASSSLNATANLVVSMVGIELDRDSIDYGDVAPGENSAVETVGITNIGTLKCNVTLEVIGANAIAQNFYQQSLHINSNLYNEDATIASITAKNTQNVNTQLKVPMSWTETGKQDAVFVFWAEAA